MLEKTTTRFLAVIALLAGSLWSTDSHAERTYTPSQLRSMVQSGNYPKQGTPTKQTQDVSFLSCVARVESTLDAIKPNYPTAIIVNTRIIYVGKAWIDDGAMTFTCSADNKFVITTAPYL